MLYFFLMLKKKCDSASNSQVGMWGFEILGGGEKVTLIVV